MSMNNSDLTFSASINDQVTPEIAKIEQALKRAGASPTEMKMFLRAYDEATPKIKEAKRQIDAMPKQHIINISANTDNVKRGLDAVRMEAKKPLTLSFTDNLSQTLSNVRQKLSGAGNLLTLPLANALPMNLGYNLYWGLGAGMLGGAGVGLGALAKQGIGQNMQMEQSQITLQQTLKDHTKALQETGKLISIAQKTPFNYNDVLQADVRLRSYQIPAMPQDVKGAKNDPTHGQGYLKLAGDMAAAMNTPITQAVEAIADARQGYFVRLMDYGVRLQKEDFQKGGKYAGLTYEQGLTNAIKRFEGSQEMQSKTLQGIMSNLHDVMQNQVVRPIGAAPFEILKQQMGGLYNKTNTDTFQREVGGQVEKVQRGVVTLFQTLQKGKAYFDANIKQPLEDIVKTIVQFGSTIAKTFGGTSLAIVKTFAETIGLMTSGIQKLLGSGIGDFLTKWVTFFKTLQFFGIGAANPFLDLAHSINPLTFSLKGLIGSVLELPGAIAKIGTLVLIKQFLDAKQATQALHGQFKNLSQVKFDSLNADIMNMAHGLDMASTGMQKLVTRAAQGIPTGVANRPNLAVETARNAAAMHREYGTDSNQTIDAILSEMKRTGSYNQNSLNKFTSDVQTAALSAKDFGLGLKDLSRTLAIFGGAASKIGIAGYAGAPALQALDIGANALPMTHAQLGQGIYNGDTLLQRMLESYGQPSIGMLRKMGDFTQVYDIKNSAIGKGLRGNFTDRNNQYNLNDSARNAVLAQVHQLAPLANVPNIANPWNEQHMGTDINSIMKVSDPAQRAQAVFKAWSKNETTLDGVNRKVTDLTNVLNKQNATYQAYSQALDNVQLQLTMFEHTLVPLQRQIEDQQLSIQKYSFEALHPLERQMTRLNQATAEMSNTMSNAQYEMGKYASGLLDGEQAVLDQLHGLEQYNKQLQLLQVLNQQLGAQLGSTTYERGYSSYVKPMMGLTLEMQMQKAQRDQQRKQLEYDLSFGEQHYQLSQAARSKFDRQEMSFSDRMSGIQQNVPIIDRMSEAQHKMGNVQFDLQTKMFNVNEVIQNQNDRLTELQIKLQEASQSPHMRALQDQQYNLQIATTKANIALTQQQTTIDRWRAIVDDLKMQGSDLGKIFQSMLVFDKNNPFGNAMNMIEALHRLPQSLGGISDSQYKQFKSQLDKMQGAVDNAKRKNLDTSQSWFSQIKNGFLGMFSEDTWNVVAANVKKGLEKVGVGSGLAGAVGGGVGVAGEAGSILIAGGLIGNLVRLWVGRMFNSFLARFGLVNAVGGGARALFSGIEGAATNADFPRVAAWAGRRVSGAEDFLNGKKLGGGLGEALTSPFQLIKSFRQLLFGGLATAAGTAVGGPLVGLAAGALVGRPYGASTTLRQTGRQVATGFVAAGRAADKVKGAMETVEKSLKSGVDYIGKAFAPVERVAKYLYDSVPAIAKATDFLSGSRLGRAVGGFGAGIRAARGFIGDANPAARVLQPLSASLRGILPGGLLAGPLSALAMRGGIKSFASAVSDSRILRDVGKIGKGTALFSLLGLGLDTSDALGSTGKRQRGGIGSLIGTGVGAVGGGLIGGVPGAVIGSGIGSIAGSVIGKMWPEIEKSLSHGVASVIKFIPKLISKIPYALGEALGAAVKFLVATLPPLLFKGLGYVFGFLAKTAWNLLTNVIPKALFDAGSWLVKQVTSGNIFKMIGDVFSALANALVDAIKGLWKGIKGAVGGFFSGIWHGLGFAGGIDYIPRDNYPATLHQGEAVLTSTDAEAWRQTKRGGKGPLTTGKPVVGGPSLGGRFDVTGSMNSGADQNIGPFMDSIRRAHHDIETMAISHGQRIVKVADDTSKKTAEAIKTGQSRERNAVSKGQSAQTKTVSNAAKKRTQTEKAQLDKQQGNADKGYKRTHGVVSDWTKKINDKIKSTSGNLKNLNSNLGNLGKGMNMPGMGGGGHSGPFGDLWDVLSSDKTVRKNEAATRKYVHGMDKKELVHLLNSLEAFQARGGTLTGNQQKQFDELNAELIRRSNANATNLYNKADKNAFVPVDPKAAAKQMDDYQKQSKDKGQQNHDKRTQNRDKWNKDDLDKQDKQNADVEDRHKKHFDTVEAMRQAAQDAQNKIEDSGYGKIYDTTKNWLGKVSKAVKGLDSSLGLTHSHGSAHHGGDSAAAKMTHDVGTTTGYASGGLAKADPYQIGKGRLAYLNEEGHDEMVIPLAPHRRHRAVSLMKQAMGMMGGHGGIHGYANGGIAHWAHNRKSHGSKGRGPSDNGLHLLTNDYRLDQFLKGMRGNVPLPPGAVSVELGDQLPSWSYGLANATGVSGMADTHSKHKIWINSAYNPKLPQQGQVARHELGHIFDMLSMNKSSRSQFEQIMGLKGTEAWRFSPTGDVTVAGTTTPSEMFAETYRWASLGRTPDGTGAYGSQQWLTQDRLNAASQLMAAVGSGAYGGKEDAIWAAKRRAKKFANGGVSYANPLAHAHGINPERVDMGVDYAFAPGSRLDVIGRAKINIAQSSGSGWPGGGYINYTLMNGPAKGRSVFWAEDIRPTVHAGQVVSAGQMIARAVSGSSGTEIGWASGPINQTLAAALGQQNKGGDPGEFPTAAGKSFNDFLVSLGAVSGIINGKVRGKMPASWAKFLSKVHGGATDIPGVPKKLQGMGSVGAYLYNLLKKKRGKYAQAGFSNDSIGGHGHDAQLMRSISRQMGWNFADWWALDASETSHGANLANPTSSARLRGQFMDFNWGKYGPGSDPRQHPSMDEQIRSMAMYIKDRYTNPTKAWAYHRAHNSYAGGIPNVPYDGMPAILHKDERVLTAGENMKMKSKKSQEDMTPEEILRQQLKVLKDLQDEIHKSRKHLQNIQSNTDKKAEQKNLTDLNDELRKQYKAVASARAGVAVSSLAHRLGTDPSDGEATAALIAHEKVRRGNIIQNAVNAAKHSKAYKAATKHVNRARRALSRTVTRAHSKHSPGGRKVTKGERRQINAAQSRLTHADNARKAILTRARKRGDANYVVDAARRGVNKDILRQVRGKKLGTVKVGGKKVNESKLYDKLVKQLQTGDKHASATAKQLRSALTKGVAATRKDAANRHKENKKTAEVAKKQRDITAKETHKTVSIGDKSDKKREKAEKDADKREKDFYKKALDHLAKIAGKSLSVNVHNEAHGATIKTTTATGNKRAK